MTPVAPVHRLRRLVRRRSVGRAVYEAGARELACRRTERALVRAPRGNGPIAVGPFVGEVGFELLYWIPMLRRLLGELRIDRERVVAFTRGGAAAWYRDFAAGSVEILDLMPPDEFVSRLRRQREVAGHARQLRVGELDRELIRRLRGVLEPALVVHPQLVYTRLRHVWDGLEPVSELERHTSYRPLSRSPDGPAELRPQPPYLAVKAYFSECFPDSPANRSFLRRLLERTAGLMDVVLLTAEPQLDDHAEWSEAPPGVSLIAGIDPRSNLAVQTELVAAASAFLSTYGGFSYLGPLTGVPTRAFYTRASFNGVHLDALRQGLAPASYELFRAGDDGELEAALASVLAGVSRPGARSSPV